MIYSLFFNNNDCYKESKSVQFFSYVSLRIIDAIGGKGPISKIILKTSIWSRKYLIQNNKGFERNNFIRKELQNGVFRVINERCTNNKMDYFHR